MAATQADGTREGRLGAARRASIRVKGGPPLRDGDSHGAALGTAVACSGKRLRVLQLIPTLTVGGAERMVALLSHHLKRSGHAVGVVSMYAPFGTWIEAELEANGIPVHFLGKRRGFDGRMIPRIASVVARFRPDVVHTHMYVLKYALAALAISRPKLAVHTLHNQADLEAGRVDRMLQYLAFRSAVVPVAIGQAVAESVRRVYGMAPRRTIPNGISVADYAPPLGAREEVRASLRVPPAAPTFLTVGRLEPQKNVEGLIRAFASPRLAAAGALLLVAGDGILRGDLERLARDLGVAERVRFLGVRDDIPRVLAAADVFALASLYEGNPLVVMEAMAAGKPVVATAVGCVPELVAEGAGVLVPPRDEPGLEAALFALARDAARARELGAAASLVARARFDASVMARAYEELYQGAP